MNISSMLKKWFPVCALEREWSSRLAEFYKNNAEYHAMTASGNKETHPQVQLLLCLLKEDGVYAEVGCGGGRVSKIVGQRAQVYGFDFSEIAIENAQKESAGSNVTLACAPGDNLPLEDSSFDGCYSFEVLEHVWDPIAVVREMIRVVKKDGFILVSAPLHFSLDLYLEKRTMVRVIEKVFARMHLFKNLLDGKSFYNIKPNLEEIYPDCDMITSLVPHRFAKFVESAGCVVDFRDTTYMRAHAEGSKTSLDFQRNTGRGFVKHFGDHLLLLAHKR